MALPDSPLTRGEQYLAKAAGQDTALPNVPLTRVEQYLAKIAGQDVAIPNVPLTRLEQYLAAIAENGGGSSITVEPLTVTSNGTRTAPEGTAYSPVTVNVPQPSGTKAVTQNGDYNVASYANVDVNVQPGKILDRNGKLSTILGTGGEFAAFRDLLAVNKISAFVYYEFNGASVLMPIMRFGSNDIGGMVFKSDGTMENTMGAVLLWNIAGNCNVIALMGGQLQDLSSYAPAIDANLSVYGTSPISY